MPSRTTLVVFSLVPVVAPAVVLLAVQTVVAPYIGAASTATRTLSKRDPEDATAPPPAATHAGDAPQPHALPDAVLAPGAPYVVTCERLVSRPVPATALLADGGEKPVVASLLMAYLRGTMEAFTWMPQGVLIRALTKDPARRCTFDAGVVRSLDYAVGDVVAGVHEVVYRGDSGSGSDSDSDVLCSRVELTLGTVPDWPQLTVHGIIVAEAVRCGDAIVFTNETWMWRHTETEKPTLLESAPGRWVHRLIGSWLLFKGIKAVTKM